MTVPASLDALARADDLRIVLVGRGDAVAPYLAGEAAKRFGDRIRLREASQVVTMDEKPQDALRKKKDSSMRVAIDLVKAGEADACVSAGNTGALMATGRFVLKTVDGIDHQASVIRDRSMFLAEETLSNTFDFAQKLVRMKEPQELAQLQSEFVSRQAQVLGDQTKELGQTIMQGATAVAKTTLEGAAESQRKRSEAA